VKVCGFRVKFVEVCEWFDEVCFVVEKILIRIIKITYFFKKYL